MGSVYSKVRDYAPEGGKLVASHYADGKCTHVFTDYNGIRHEVVVGPHEDEEAMLKAFRDRVAYSMEVLKSGSFEAPVGAAATIPAPPPKPSRRKAGNGG